MKTAVVQKTASSTVSVQVFACNDLRMRVTVFETVQISSMKTF